MSSADHQQPVIDIIEVSKEHLDAAASLFDAYRQFYKQSSDWEGARTFLLQHVTNGTSRIFLAWLQVNEEEPRAVGFMQLYPTFESVSMRSMWILNDLFVDPMARSKGVGRTLLVRARQLAQETGAGDLMLQTAHDNFPAQALYESEGWKQDKVFLTYMLSV
jgi:GNAT superfamily N-acetyltransferase